MIDNGFLKKQTEAVEKRIQKGDFEEYYQSCGIEKFYGPHPEIYEYFKNLELSDKLLSSIKSISFEGGNEVYHLIAHNWDGEDNIFDVRSLEDVCLAPNLEELVDCVLVDVDDASPLLQLKKLRSVDVNYDGGIKDKKTISQLEKKGVQILNRAEDVSEKKESSGKSNLVEDLKFIEEYEKAQDLFYDKSDPRRALPIFEKLISQRPEDADCWMEKGNVHSELGNDTEAEKAWLKCIELDPGYDEVHYNLANIKKDKKQYSEAMELVQKAIESGMADRPEAWHIMGQLHCLLDDPAAGRKVFEKALKLYEKESETTDDAADNRFQLACIHSLLGNAEKALYYLREAVEIDGSSRDRAKDEPDFHSIKNNSMFVNYINE